MKRGHKVKSDRLTGNCHRWRANEYGFTLVELLIAVAISALVIMAIYSVYMNHLKTATAQEKIVAMRQNWRVAHFVVGRDLMKAGYSSNIVNPTQPGFIRAEKSALTFTYVDDTTDALVSVGFALADNKIVRTTATAGAVTVNTAIAEDIEALQFIYQLKDESTTWAPGATDLDDIRAVRVSVLARTTTPVGNYPNPDSFALPFPDGETENTLSFSPDCVYRQLVTGFFSCRNMADH